MYPIYHVCLSHRTYLLLWYRVDYFEALGLQPPETWDELFSLAVDSSIWQPLTSPPSPPQPGPASVGQNASDDSTGPAMIPPVRRHVLASGNSTASPDSNDHTIRGLCLDLAPNCAGSHVLAAIFASLAAYAGNSQVCADVCTSQQVASADLLH
jgi:hypothetical protein